MDVLEFKGETAFLSNFYPAVVLLDGVEYPTVEHAYQAAKTLDLEIRKKFLQTSGPGGAKKLGQTIKIRDDWENAKIGIMDDLVRQKFQNRRLKRLLSNCTGQIVEGNFWGDTFWGVCKGQGRNELGKILMKIRDEL